MQKEKSFLTLVKYAVLWFLGLMIILPTVVIVVVSFTDKSPKQVIRKSAPIYAEIPAVKEVSREDELIDIYSYAYDASGRLSRGDFRLIAKFEMLQADWNAALTPLVRGLRDPNMVPEDWVRSAGGYLNEVEIIKVKMAIIVGQVGDPSAQSIIRKISGINDQIFIAWTGVRQAIAAGDGDAYQRYGMRAQGLAQEKANVAGPILRRLREKVGDKAVDGGIERELRELARKVGM
jgi:hypothetical protein